MAEQYTAEELGLLVAALRAGVMPARWTKGWGIKQERALVEAFGLETALKAVACNGSNAPWPNAADALIAAARALGLQADPIPGAIPPDVAGAAVLPEKLREQAKNWIAFTRGLARRERRWVRGAGAEYARNYLDMAAYHEWEANVLETALQGQAAPGQAVTVEAPQPEWQVYLNGLATQMSHRALEALRESLDDKADAYNYMSKALGRLSEAALQRAVKGEGESGEPEKRDG